MNIILIVSRGLDIIATIITGTLSLDGIEITRESDILLIWSKTFSLCILFFVHAFESLIYLKMDKNIKQVVAGILKCKQVK